MRNGNGALVRAWKRARGAWVLCVLSIGLSARVAPAQQATTVVDVKAGSAHILVLKSDGTVWMCGNNQYGQSGDNTTFNHATLKPVHNLLSVTAISGGAEHSLALKSDGTVWAWGDNQNGELGNGSFTNSGSYGIATPGKALGLSGIIAISAGSYHSLALDSLGNVWAWGYNQYGELGNGSAGAAVATPGQVSALTGVVAVAAGGYHSAALKSNGTVWTWGYNQYGQLGNGTFASSATPMQVSGLSGVIAIAAGAEDCLALKSDGTVWAWGYNQQGELGNGAFTTSSPYGIATPGQVTGLSHCIAIAAGPDHSMALKSDGTVWAWGENTVGQLGNGTSTTSAPYGIALAMPVSGIAGVEVTAISAGSEYSVVLKSDGTVWTWGLNADGQLGNGTITTTGNQSIATPAEVISGLSGPALISAGGAFALAVREDGRVWAWGDNITGQLGNGTVPTNTPLSSGLPVKTVGLSSIVTISAGGYHSLALDSGGNVWAWGDNQYGELGHASNTDGDILTPNGSIYVNGTPTKISGLPEIVAVAAGWYLSLALDVNGNVWTWGLNNDGQLGNGSFTNSSAPVQVSGLSNVVAIAGGNNFSLALKSDGTVWAWGENDYGELGNGGFTTTSPVGIATPAQVSGLSNVVAIGAGYYHSIALDADGNFWDWGGNQFGQLGLGTFTNVGYQGIPTPSQVTDLPECVAISAGAGHSQALDVDGTSWAWGENLFGELGAAPITYSSPYGVDLPTNMSLFPNTPRAAISEGGYFGAALFSDGTVWTWGDDDSGQLGDDIIGLSPDPDPTGPVLGLNVPTLTSLSPSYVFIRNPGFTLTINGRGFMPGAVVYWKNGCNPQITLSTTYVTTNQLTAVVPRRYLSSSATVYITVSNPIANDISAIAVFTIAPIPNLGSHGIGGGGSFTGTPGGGNLPALP